MNFKHFVICAIIVVSLFSGCIDDGAVNYYTPVDTSYYIRNPCDNSSLIQVSEYDYYTMDDKPCYNNRSDINEL